MSVSAVVLQYGLFEMTRTAVESLRASDCPPGEVIVVDNGSPQSWEFGALPEVRLVRLTVNQGYTAGTNAGWEKARGEFALLCNNDVSLSRQCLRRLVEAMQADPRLGWVSACYQAGGWESARTIFPAWVLEPLDASRGADRKALDEWAETLIAPELTYADVTESTVVLVRRAAWEDMGLFDPELVYHHSHDYGLRLREKGWKLANLHTAVYWHNVNHPTLGLPGAWGTPAQREQSDQRMNDKWGDAWKKMAW